jgi:hypothetical protein
MGVGFIQLITNGEDNIFTNKPQITYFKIYYRRYSNFFINNYEIPGNELKKNNNIINFIIPKSGDFLSKSYVNITNNENYVELFNEYTSLNTTLIDNILNYYDSYSIRVETFNKNLINFLDIVKINFIYNNDNTYFILMSTNIIDSNNLLSTIKFSENILLETDLLKLFYNCNQIYNFYSFNSYVTSSLNNFNIFLPLLLNDKNIALFDIIRIDIINYNLSFNIKFNNTTNLNKLITLIFNDINFENQISMKINKYDIYFKLNYNNIPQLNILYNQIINIILADIVILDLEVIDNKIKSTIVTIKDNISEKLMNLFNNINSKYYIYYNIIYNATSTNIQLYLLKNTPFFGNLSNNDFNESLISNETQLISVSNLCSYKLPINLYIRIIVSLVCNKIISIQEYLKIINNQSFDIIKLLSKYFNNTNDFDTKILDIIVNPFVILFSQSGFRKLLYDYSIKENYALTNLITPFTNKIISNYQAIINYKYLYNNIIVYSNNKYNQSYNNYDIFLTLMINISSIVNSFETNQDILQNYLYNYDVNNNLFDKITLSSSNNILINKNIIKYDTFYKNIYDLLAYNYVLNYITESITTLNNIYFKISDNIYDLNGLNTNLFNSNYISNSIFPLSSSIFVYTSYISEETTSYNFNDMQNTPIIFNTSIDDYFLNINNTIINSINIDYNLYNINFNNKNNYTTYSNLITNPYLTDFINIINNFYNEWKNNQNLIDPTFILGFLNIIAIDDYNSIYNYTLNNINDFVLLNLFQYTSSNLYAQSFIDYVYIIIDDTGKEYKTNFIEQQNYLYFIFTINSPIYRIYYLFTYLAHLSIDPYYSKYITQDIENFRDITLNFVLEYINYFYNIDITNDLNFSSYDLTLLRDNKYNLINNFICYDNINIFTNSYFNYLMYESYKQNYVFLYNSTYFCKNINSTNFLDTYKYNYDDIIIILYLNVLQKNSTFFNNFTSIYKFANLFFNKINFDFTLVVEETINLLSNNTTNNVDPSILKNDFFYYDCYYTTNSIGCLFDNNNKIIINANNNIYNCTLSYNNYDEIFKNFYFVKTFDIKQYQNYLDTNNLTDGFKNTTTFFNNLFYAINNSSYRYYDELLNSIYFYISSNYEYLNKYIISEYIFDDAVNIILKYLTIFNIKNNSNVDINIYTDAQYSFTYDKFTRYNFIIIYYLYYSFIKNCCIIDVKNYNTNNKILSTTLDKYIISLYSINIYVQCLNDLIILFTSNNIKFYLDYSTIFILNTLSNTTTELVYLEDSLAYMDIVFNSDVDYSVVNSRVLFNKLNVNSNVLLSNINSSVYIINYEIDFYKNFNDQLNNFINQFNKILYLKINEDNTNINLTSENNYDTLLNQYIEKINTIYNSSIYILQNNIYTNLYNSYNSINFTDNYSNKICNIIINTIKYYYDSSINYFSSIYYKKCLNYSSKNNNQNFNNKNFINKNINNSELENVDKISLFFNLYVNTNINSSILYEKELNRILYYLCTNYAINNSSNKFKAAGFSKINSLYKFVKIYKIDNKVKKYLLNTSLYDNQEIFELFNFDNWTNINSFLQNYWFNYVISNINYSLTNSVNSYYSYYIDFKNFCLYNYPEIINFKLLDGTSVINYFTNNQDTINELHNFIFDFCTISDLFSPINIYNSIINLLKSYTISFFLTIDTDNIKKKIIVFLYVMYIIFINIPILLKDNLKFDNDLFLEYDFEFETVTFSLATITNNIDNIIVLNYYIDKVFMFNDLNISTPYDSISLEYMIESATLQCNFKNNFILLIKKYISSYDLLVGNEIIVYNNTIPPNPTSTLTNLINRINSIYCNDIIIQNPKKYFLTINTINLLNIYPINIIYDLNNTYYNYYYLESNIFINYFNTFLKSDVSNINFTLNLLCSLLNFYNIKYSSLNSDVSYIINNLRFGETYLNNNLEVFKGVSTIFNIATDYVDNNYNDYSNSDLLTSKSNNIYRLSTIANDLKNLSLITPNDYDFTVNNINYLNIYNGFYTKYYNYEYNYYNFYENYNVIYKKLLNYYNNILEDNNAISNLKKSDIKIYTIIFIDIIKTILANYYYNGYQYNTGYVQINSYYIDTINQIINLYLNYNFSFRLNKNITNSKNLLIQNFYNKKVEFTSYSEIFNYLISLYYYELLSDDIASNIPTTSSNDIISFFNNLNIYQNYNFQYIFNLINYFFRLKLSIILFINLVSYNTISLSFDYTVLSNIIDDYLRLIVNPVNVNKFLHIQSVDNNYTKNMYDTITNIIEYSDFLNKLTNSLLEILYYENNYSYQVAVYNTWVKYFQNYNFNIYYYSYNNYEINNYTLLFSDFELVVYDFINYFVNYDSEINNNRVVDRLAEFIINVFSPISNNQEYIFNTIYTLLFYNNTNNNLNQDYINISNSAEYFINVKNIIDTIKNTLKGILWGQIYYNTNYNSKVNYDLKLQLFLFNFYYVYLNEQIPISNYNQNTDYIINYINRYHKLYIIYYIIINVITLNYISDNIYDNIFYLSLIDTNTYTLYGQKIFTINLIKSIIPKMDFLNKNIYPLNTINNYYKNVQDDTISQIIKYNVPNFINPIYNVNNLLASIFDVITNNFYYKTEIEIGTVFYNNLITCIINNYNTTVDITQVGIPGEIVYINNLYKSLLVNINNNLITFKNILGGYAVDINNINLTTQNIIQIYNTKAFEIDNKPITIFTLLYNEFNNIVNNDMVIILFYYTVFITWLSINGNDYDNIDKYIYDFVNLINVNITKYISINNTIISNNNLTPTQIYDLEYLENFFNGLNVILFNVYNNTEFSNLCSNFFNTYISNNYQYSNNNAAVNFNNISYNGTTTSIDLVAIEKKYYTKQIYNTFIKNNKIITWKLMQGVIVDYNLSNVTKALKSILEINNIINVTDTYIAYISSLNNGIINKFGIIKILDSIKLLFDDEMIDNYNSDMYKIFINLFVNLNKFDLIYEMLGLNFDNNNQDYMLTGLKPYILNFKNKNFSIPLNFFFKDYNNVIPLIACMYTQIQVNIQFNSNNLIKNSYTIVPLTPTKINTSLNMDLILVEKDERITVCTKLIDNLIERHGSYSSSNTITNDILNTNSDTIFIKFDFHIPYVIKEIYWTLEFYINNYSLYNKSNYSNSTENIYDFILNTRFFIDGAKRDGVDVLNKKNYNYITTILNSYKYNTRAYSNDNYFYNVYSFALQPENFQPTGAFNLSKFNVFTIELEIDRKKLYNYINNFSNLYNLNKLVMSMKLNTLEYNMLRYQSGLSGLLFV